MILRVYAMWNQSKMILYILLFIYVPQVIVSFVAQGIYTNTNTCLSGMSQAKLQAGLESHYVVSNNFHQSQLCNLQPMLLFANFQPSPAVPHYN